MAAWNWLNCKGYRPHSCMTDQKGMVPSTPESVLVFSTWTTISGGGCPFQCNKLPQSWLAYTPPGPVWVFRSQIWACRLVKSCTSAEFSEVTSCQWTKRCISCRRTKQDVAHSHSEVFEGVSTGQLWAIEFRKKVHCQSWSKTSGIRVSLLTILVGHTFSVCWALSVDCFGWPLDIKENKNDAGSDSKRGQGTVDPLHRGEQKELVRISEGC